MAVPETGITNWAGVDIERFTFRFGTPTACPHKDLVG